MSAASEAHISRVPWRVLALLALPPALIAVLQLGRLHCDEVFQMLEPAHEFAFGGTTLPWEWDVGLRNWAMPGFFGLLLKACGALGIDDPQMRRAVLEVPQYGLHLLSLAALYRLFRRRLPALGEPGTLRDGVLWAVGLVALYAPVLHYAGRTLSESISTSLLLIAFERLEPRGAAARRYVLAGVLLASAIVVRYGSAVFAVASGLWLLKERRLRDAIWFSVGGLIPLAFVGLLDHLTWGGPFHSFFAYLDYNVLSRDAAIRFGTEPWWFYIPWMAVAVSFWAWPALLAYFSERGPERSRTPAPIGLLLWCVAWYLIVVSRVEHKEPRFLYPAMVLVTAAAAPTWIAILRSLPRRRMTAGLGLSLAAGLALLFFKSDFNPKRAGQFQLFVQAAREGTGVVLLHSGVWATPGHFYSGTRPWLLCDIEEKGCLRYALADKTFNRVVGWRDEGERVLKRAGFRVVATRGSANLWARSEKTKSKRSTANDIAERGPREQPR